MPRAGTGGDYFRELNLKNEYAIDDYILVPDSVIEFAANSTERYSPAFAHIDLMFHAAKYAFYVDIDDDGELPDLVMPIGTVKKGLNFFLRRWRWKKREMRKFIRDYQEYFEVVAIEGCEFFVFSDTKFIHYQKEPRNLHAVVGLLYPNEFRPLSQAKQSSTEKLRLTGKKYQETRERILRRDRYRCKYCGVKKPESMHMDHVIPLKKGGTNEDSNLVAACQKCNLNKGSKTLEEWKLSHNYPHRVVS